MKEEAKKDDKKADAKKPTGNVNQYANIFGDGAERFFFKEENKK